MQDGDTVSNRYLTTPPYLPSHHRTTPSANQSGPVLHERSLIVSYETTLLMLEKAIHRARSFLDYWSKLVPVDLLRDLSAAVTDEARDDLDGHAGV